MTDSTQMAQTENNGRHQATQDRPVSRVLQALKRFFWMDEQMAAAVRDGYELTVTQRGLLASVLASAACGKCTANAPAPI